MIMRPVLSSRASCLRTVRSCDIKDRQHFAALPRQKSKGHHQMSRNSGKDLSTSNDRGAWSSTRTTSYSSRWRSWKLPWDQWPPSSKSVSKSMRFLSFTVHHTNTHTSYLSQQLHAPKLWRFVYLKRLLHEVQPLYGSNYSKTRIPTQKITTLLQRRREAW